MALIVGRSVAKGFYRPGARNAAATDKRAARIAGGIPPIMLMPRANPIVASAEAGVRVRRKASSEKVLKFMSRVATNFGVERGVFCVHDADYAILVSGNQ